MGLFKALLTIVLCIVVFIVAIMIFDEIRYSFKYYKELNDNNATCYFDRGWFNIPLAKICTYNNTILIKKENNTYLPRHGMNISVFPTGSWVVRD